MSSFGRARALFGFLLAALVASCSGSECVSGPLCDTGGGGGGGGAVTISLSAPNTTLVSFGATVQIAANVQNTTSAPTWTSSDANVARVNASGLVTSVADGAATITATVAGTSATIGITVAQAVAQVQVTPAGLSLTSLGETAQLSATPVDANGNPVASVTVVWTTTDAAVASVSAGGLVTAEGNGTATVSAAAGGQQGSVGVDVAFDDVLPQLVSVTPVANEYDVWVHESVIVTFTEAMDDTRADAVRVDGPGGRVSGVLSFTGAVVTFTPDAPLVGFSQYQVTATTDALDLAGNALATDVSASFWTGPNEDMWYTLTNEALPAENLAANGSTCQMQTATFGSPEYIRFVNTSGDRYNIRTEATGNSRQLEAGDGAGPCLWAPSGPFSGMNWVMTPLFDGTFLLQSESFGALKALDGTSSPRMVDVAPPGPFTGQRWTITEQSAVVYSQIPEAAFSQIADTPSGNTHVLSDFWGYLPATPGAYPIITPSAWPFGASNNAPTGAWWSGSNWFVFNQDGSPISTNMGFNVLHPLTMGVTSFAHLAQSGVNITSNFTSVDHPVTNGNPGAIVFVTPAFNPNSVYVPTSVGVWYNSGSSEWTIFTEDQTAMPDLSNYHVMIANAQSNAHVVTSDGSGVVVIDHPDANGNSDAIITVTQNLSGPGGSVYNNAHIAVWYDGANWVIFNQNGTNVPLGANFNVLIGDGFSEYN